MIVQHADVPSKFVPSRKVEVWLPDSYAINGKKHFSVLYMHDGQNLFNPETATDGQTWGVAEALSRLMSEGVVRPTIIVGIFNTRYRWPEYLPKRPFTHFKGLSLRTRLKAFLASPIRSQKYLRFVVDELKPFIDRTYRTLPSREDTFMMGSSMGGLISLYALCEYPDRFAGIASLSTHWPAVKGLILPYLKETLPPPGRHKLYFDYGSEGLDADYEILQKPVDDLLKAKGYQEGQDWQTHSFPGAPHNETAWRSRIHLPLTFLLAA